MEKKKNVGLIMLLWSNEYILRVIIGYVQVSSGWVLRKINSSEHLRRGIVWGGLCQGTDRSSKDYDYYVYIKVPWGNNHIYISRFHSVPVYEILAVETFQ